MAHMYRRKRRHKVQQWVHSTKDMPSQHILLSVTMAKVYIDDLSVIKHAGGAATGWNNCKVARQHSSQTNFMTEFMYTVAATG